MAFTSNVEVVYGDVCCSDTSAEQWSAEGSLFVCVVFMQWIKARILVFV
jgi:hypothetical protein